MTSTPIRFALAILSLAATAPAALAGLTTAPGCPSASGPASAYLDLQVSKLTWSLARAAGHPRARSVVFTATPIASAPLLGAGPIAEAAYVFLRRGGALDCMVVFRGFQLPAPGCALAVSTVYLDTCGACRSAGLLYTCF